MLVPILASSDYFKFPRKSLFARGKAIFKYFLMHWRKVLRDNFTHWEKLADFLELDEEFRSKILKHPSFPLNLPRRLANKIKKNCLDDPILRQFLPLRDELLSSPGFSLDPVEDSSFLQGNKLLKKYEGRALLITAGVCAMNCRFCFRKNFTYKTKEKGFEKELNILVQDTSISEIILSGGDPLSLGNEALFDLIKKLDRIDHLKLLRFHTRYPIGIPERIDNSFLRLLSECRLQVVFILHVNHPDELDDDVLLSCKKIMKLGIPIRTHTVLLEGVNDDLTTLKNLFTLLIHHGIMPYYLNQLDRVSGTAHFEVSIDKGKKLIEELTTLLPGYAIPRYAQEIPGSKSKTAL